MAKAITSIIAMGIAGIVGWFAGAFLNNAFGGAILFSMIIGIACIIYTIDTKGNPNEPVT